MSEPKKGAVSSCVLCGEEIIYGGLAWLHTKVAAAHAAIPSLAPKSNAGEIEELIVAKIRRRRDQGRLKYGTSMERTDLTKLEWLRHAQDEALDFAIYLERPIREETEESK